MTAARPIAVTAAGLLLAACGSASSTTGTHSSATAAGTATSMTTTDTPSPSPSASSTTATATPAPASSSSTTTDSGPIAMGIGVYWAVQTPSGTQLRKVSLTGGAGSTVVLLPTDTFLLTMGFGHAIVARPSGVLQVLSLSTGAVTATGHYNGNQPLGAAMSPDGAKVAFLDGSPGAYRVGVMTVASGAVATLTTGGSGSAPSPSTWGDAIGAVSIVPNSDAGPQGAMSLNPSTGAHTGTTNTTGAGGVLVSGDGRHGAAVVHTDLGDNGDAAPGPGPQGPFNTLQTFTIGSAPTTVLSEAHHNISVLATLPGGDKYLVWDNSAAGGFAGISMNGNFGILVQTGSTRKQYLHYDGTDYDGGVFLQDGSTVVVANHDSSGSHLRSVTPSGTVSDLDTVAGGTGGSVYLVVG